jgi:LysR family transcriptional regulator, hypochlorite-specific transcription factor HypT
VRSNAVALSHYAENDMDLNWLTDFVALTESGSFSRAAAQRHITQPAFSRRIRALEHWTGTALFERGARAVTLTEAGRRLLPWAETLRRQVSEARADVRIGLGLPVEPLRIAATHSLSLTFFSQWIDLIGPFNLAPVELASESLAGCERLMSEGRVQFLLAHSHPATPVRLDPALFRSALIGTDSLTPVAAPRIAAAIDKNGGDSPAYPFITYSEDSSLGRILSRHLIASGKIGALEPVLTSHHAGVLKAMAISGRGVAWLPRSLILAELDRGDLVTVRMQAGSTIALEIRLFRPTALMCGAAESFWAAADRDRDSASGADVVSSPIGRCLEPRNANHDGER